MKSEEKPSCESIFSHLRPPENLLFIMKMASPVVVCVVKQITGTYRNPYFLIHFSEIHTILPCSLTTLLKQIKSGHHRRFSA